MLREGSVGGRYGGDQFRLVRLTADEVGRRPDRLTHGRGRRSRNLKLFRINRSIRDGETYRLAATRTSVRRAVVFVVAATKTDIPVAGVIAQVTHAALARQRARRPRRHLLALGGRLVETTPGRHRVRVQLGRRRLNNKRTATSAAPRNEDRRRYRRHYYY